jgi:hypothetical protein
MPAKLDITDTERMERRKQATKEWKQRKILSNPEYHEKLKKYNRDYFQKIKEGMKKEKEEEKLKSI